VQPQVFAFEQSQSGKPVTSVLALPRLPLGTSEIHLWWLMGSLDAAVLAPFHAVLNDTERARAARFIFAHDRARSVLAQGVLRYVLSAYGCGLPETLCFHREPRGKPILAHEGPAFSLSHSGAMIMLAIAPPGLAVGLDIEKVRHVERASILVERFFSAAERNAWKDVPPAQQDAAFFRLWTRKEAFVKATGEGLTRPLNGFTVTLGDPPTIIDLPGWSLHHVEPLAGYIGALAAAHPAPLLSSRQLAPTPVPEIKSSNDKQA
jgi:4'-phosphopantetheinyl transferase